MPCAVSVGRTYVVWALKFSYCKKIFYKFFISYPPSANETRRGQGISACCSLLWIIDCSEPRAMNSVTCPDVGQYNKITKNFGYSYQKGRAGRGETAAIEKYWREEKKLLASTQLNKTVAGLHLTDISSKRRFPGRGKKLGQIIGKFLNFFHDFIFFPPVTQQSHGLNLTLKFIDACRVKLFHVFTKDLEGNLALVPYCQPYLVAVLTANKDK